MFCYMPVGQSASEYGHSDEIGTARNIPSSAGVYRAKGPNADDIASCACAEAEQMTE